jgi:hypothetical protein
MASTVVTSTDIAVPYAIQADSHSAELFRRAVASTLPPTVRARESGQGGIISASGADPDFYVYAVASEQQVGVLSGECWVPGSQGESQGLYYCFNPSVQTFTITPPGAGSQCYILTVTVEDAEYSGSNNAFYLQLVAETAGIYTVPTPSANSLVIATILVPSTATSSANYVIIQGLATACTSTTLTPPVGAVGGGVTTTAQSQGNTLTIGDPAARMALSSAFSLSASVAQVTGFAADFLRGGFTFASNGLVVPVAGKYLASLNIGANASSNGTLTGTLSGFIYQNGTRIRAGRSYVSAFYPMVNLTSIIDCAAADAFTVYAVCAATTFADPANGNSVPIELSMTLVSF